MAGITGMDNRVAPEGTVFVCAACGKRSRDRYGEQAIDRGWDASCFVYAVLCREDSVVIRNDRVVSAELAGEANSGVPDHDNQTP